MPISILPPEPARGLVHSFEYEYDDSNISISDDEDGADADDDIDMFASRFISRSISLKGKQKRKRDHADAIAKRTSPTSIVTPGQVVTSDPQWMRGHGTYLATPSGVDDGGDDGSGGGEEGHSGAGSLITSSVAGTIQKVNKLLSVSALKGRYHPEIGDLVVGRIVEVQSKRWKVDINSHQNATLLLSSINLPGGILRRRTASDELQIRSFFSEGELVVAEVQSLFADGSASLHTRSLKYGKLRNGYFVKVDPKGIVRSKSHMLTVVTRGGGGSGEVEIMLGINGYIFVAQKSAAAVGAAVNTLNPSSIDASEHISEALYSTVNDYIAPDTRGEIARIGECIRAMVRCNVRIDEAGLNAVYDESWEMDLEDGVGIAISDAGLDGAAAVGGGGIVPGWLDGARGKKVVERGLSRIGR